MIDQKRFDDDRTALMDDLRARLGVRGGALRTRLKRAGRRLPKPARRAGRTLIEAERWMAHPKLRLRIDPDEVGAAFGELHGSLARIDPRERRKGMALGIAGSVVFNLLLVGAALLAFLWWQGLL